MVSSGSSALQVVATGPAGPLLQPNTVSTSTREKTVVQTSLFSLKMPPYDGPGP